MANPPTAYPRNRPAVPADDLADTAKLLLRVALGLLMLLHGIGKLNGGIAFVLAAVSKTGLPSALGYLVYVGELVAPVLLIVGALTRPAAIIVAINMVVAVWLVHAGQLWSLTPNGGWAIELQALYLVVALGVALLGAGRFSAGRVGGLWN